MLFGRPKTNIFLSYFQYVSVKVNYHDKQHPHEPSDEHQGGFRRSFAQPSDFTMLFQPSYRTPRTNYRTHIAYSKAINKYRTPIEIQ